MQFANPTRSLQELQVELGIPIAQLYRLTAHLVYWRQAKVIHKVTLNNIYRCNTSVVYQNLVHEFGPLFPSFSLGECLKLFITPQKLEDAIPPTNQTRFIKAVIWMLQRNLLVQLHQFVYFVPHLTNSENVNEIIESLNDGPSKAYLLFVRLIPYFNGKITLQEMMWRENIDYATLQKVISKFSSVLLCTMHEAVADTDSFCLRK